MRAYRATDRKDDFMNADFEWWKTFFSGLVVDFWKIALPPERTRAEADFLESQLALSPGARVLDVPCGHGRLAIELAARGCFVTGVDISAELLAVASEDASARGISATSWRLSDMRDLPWVSAFDAAFCAGSSFGFLGDAGDAEFLGAVSRALVPKGRFVLDASKVLETILPAFRESHEMEKDGIRFEATNRWDARAGRYENRYTISRDGVTETKLASHRVYSVRELCRMLEGAGFEELSLLGSLTGEEFRLGSPALFVAASTRASAAPGA
jgi:SAM-dependent methyltransferase